MNLLNHLPLIKGKKPTRLTFLGIIILFIGIIFLKLEGVFYGNRLDENNVIQESWFMPLSIIFIFVGVIILLIQFILFILHIFKK
jgi:hypothetical protein